MGGTTSRVIVHPPVSRAETGCGHTPSAGVISAASYPVLVTGRPQVSSGMEKPVTEIFCHRPAIAVRERGVEPPRPEGHWHLKPARLPFRHSRIGPARTQLEKISTKMTAVENRGRTASPVPGFTSLGSSPTSLPVPVRSPPHAVVRGVGYPVVVCRAWFPGGALRELSLGPGRLR